MTSKPYNGHKNYNHWNVALWVHNDESLYALALRLTHDARTMDEAASTMLATLHANGITKTPDGAPYSVTAIRAAMVGMK